MRWFALSRKLGLNETKPKTETASPKKRKAKALESPKKAKAMKSDSEEDTGTLS